MTHDNYNRVLDRIHLAARLAGRNESSIRLVVVTKTHPLEMVNEVIAAGATDLGENYIEEAILKINAISNNKSINWHMIGHLQSRKAQNFCQYFQFLHSLDSVKLAERIGRFASEVGKIIPVWLEFNVGGEVSKSGWDISDGNSWGALLPEIAKIISLPNIEALGAMTIPPYSDDPELSRPYFSKLREFQAFVIDQLQPPNFRELSMGMSSDFEVAIQEGSTCVRIGQAIFGPRT
jgi:pyridoxal phosphate enzyme (YggS family)